MDGVEVELRSITSCYVRVLLGLCLGETLTNSLQTNPGLEVFQVQCGGSVFSAQFDVLTRRSPLTSG